MAIPCMLILPSSGEELPPPSSSAELPLFSPEAASSLLSLGRDSGRTRALPEDCSCFTGGRGQLSFGLCLIWVEPESRRVAEPPPSASLFQTLPLYPFLLLFFPPFSLPSFFPGIYGMFCQGHPQTRFCPSRAPRD